MTEVSEPAARLPASLHAEHVGRGRHRMVDDCNLGRVAGARQRIIHERAGQELAILVVHRHFHQRLSDALDHAAVQLAFDDQRVDDGAEVIDRGIFDHGDHAGVGIQFDFADMTAVGIGGGTRAVADVADVERGRYPLGQIKAGAELVGESP